jgi:hypothetical protein
MSQIESWLLARCPCDKGISIEHSIPSSNRVN